MRKKNRNDISKLSVKVRCYGPGNIVKTLPMEFDNLYSLGKYVRENRDVHSIFVKDGYSIVGYYNVLNWISEQKKKNA